MFLTTPLSEEPNRFLPLLLVAFLVPIVLAVRRNDELIIPRGNTVLEPEDRLTLVGDIEGLEAIADWLEGRVTLAAALSSPLSDILF